MGVSSRRGQRVCAIARFVIAVVAAFAATELAAEDGDIEHVPVDVLLHQRVSAPDGLSLSATVWKPAATGKVPAVLVVTPYISDEAHGRARHYADRGYAMVSLDRRGRGDSDGVPQVFTDVGPDACAVIDWIRRQPWSDGRIAMRGGSYRGMTQWMTARHCPDALVTLIPTASAYPGEDFPRVGPHGTYAYLTRWLALTHGRTGNTQLFSDDEYWERKFADAHRRYLPFAQLDRFVGAPSTQFQQWVEGLSALPDFAHLTPTEAQYAKMELPVLTITGHYDGDQPGALRYYREHVASASPAAAAEHFLVIGPWDHGDTRRPTAELGSSEVVAFGENSVFDMDQFNLDWFDWRFGRGSKPDFLKDRVAYYLTGANRWVYASSLDAVSERTRTFYLEAEAFEAYEGFRSGQLVDGPAEASAVHTIKSDPLDVSALEITQTHQFDLIAGGEIDDPSPGYLEQTLTFHSPRLAAPMRVAGQLRLTLYLAMDTPDADLVARVWAVLPDSTVRLLGTDTVRARFRTGAPKLVTPGAIEPYVFERFFWQARELPEGAQIRLTVGPLNDPTMQKNFNTGGRLGFETAQDARVATIQLHHDAQYPSRLEVPLAAWAPPVAQDD
ncbi:MAG: CocE/NonD family hydrolase [Pseudomonadota bacterium]